MFFFLDLGRFKGRISDYNFLILQLFSVTSERIHATR
jgi:hypothetical protein